MVWPYRPIYFSRVWKICLIIWSDHSGQYSFGKVMNFLWPQWSTVVIEYCTDKEKSRILMSPHDQRKAFNLVDRKFIIQALERTLLMMSWHLTVIKLYTIRLQLQSRCRTSFRRYWVAARGKAGLPLLPFFVCDLCWIAFVLY